MIFRVAVAAVLSFILVGSPGLGADAQENKRVVERFMDALNRREFAVLEEVISPDIQRHSGATPDLTIESREQFIEFLKQDVQGVPDVRQEIDLILAEGDLVAVRARYLGTQTGQWGPFPPSGKSIELSFIGIMKLKDGQIVEIWVEWDNMNALRQLGHLPSEDQVPFASPPPE